MNPAIKGKWTALDEKSYELKPYEPTSFSFVNFKADFKSEGPKDYIIISYHFKLGFKIMALVFSIFTIVAVIVSASESDQSTLLPAILFPLIGFSVIFGFWWVIFKAHLNKIGKKLERKLKMI